MKHLGSNRNRTARINSRKGACGKVRGEASKLIDLVMAGELVPAISVFSGFEATWSSESEFKGQKLGNSCLGE